MIKPMDRNQIPTVSAVRQLVEEHSTAPPAELSSTANLFQLEIIDSFGMIELIEALESRFGLSFEAEDLTNENFASIAGIADLIDRRRGLAA